jgi:GT2 family glycosyltransferase
LDNPVSLVVVNYNAGHLLAKCIQSSLNQVDEIIIVDNASTDCSLDRGEEQYSANSKIKLIRNEKNLGFAAACNIGFSHATTDLILFLNPDCQLDKHAVAEMKRDLLSGEDVGMAGGLLLNPDGTEQGGGRRSIPTPWRSFVRAFGLYRLSKRWPKLFSDFYLHELPLPKNAVEVEAISGACMMVKRKAVDSVGSWDEGYFLHCEDLDWCMRFRIEGWKILFVPSARITHALGACSKGRPLFVEWHKHKGMMRFYRKFFKHQYPYGLMWLVEFGVWMRFSFVSLFKLIGLGRARLVPTKTLSE